MTSLCEINIKKIIIKKSYTKIWPENLIQLFSYYFRIFCKKESEKIRVLTLTYFVVLLFHIQYNQLFPKYFANTKGSRTSFQATFFEASVSHWTALKTVILYIIAKFYSLMPFLMPTCKSQRKLDVSLETPSHQKIEFLKRSTNANITCCISTMRGMYIIVGRHTFLLSLESH